MIRALFGVLLFRQFAPSKRQIPQMFNWCCTDHTFGLVIFRGIRERTIESVTLFKQLSVLVSAFLPNLC